MKLERYSKMELIKTIDFPGSYDDMYVNQFEYFIENLGRTSMMNDIFDAEVVFKKLIALKENEK